MSESSLQAALHARLNTVEERMAAACRRAGRPRAEVTLVAVTKTTGVEVASVLPELGVFHLGESRPQELWRKASALPPTICWHLVGHLQRNKIARTLPLVRFIHSADSVRLLDALEEEAGRLAEQLPGPPAVLLEVNVSREPNKHGFAPEELPGLAAQIGAYRNIHVQGLMTLAAFESDPQRCRPTFAWLRGLRDQLRSELGPPHTLGHLSMGMSNDFEAAVEEGATLVRIGSALFEGLV